jgi:uncharacterized UBP type Zn finger protein
MSEVCRHFDSIKVSDSDIRECEECVATGSGWVHLRLCMECGHVACCDSSPNKHASQHVRETGHPVVRSLEPGETWAYCYEDDLFVELT